MKAQHPFVKMQNCKNWQGASEPEAVLETTLIHFLIDQVSSEQNAGPLSTRGYLTTTHYKNCFIRGYYS